jgi:NitT/TauT family transport system substrate-binding protein
MLKFNRLLLLIAIAALSVFAVACGDDDEPSDGATGSEPAATAATGTSGATGSSGAPSDSGPAVKLGFSAWPGWFPWQVAEEKGFFEQAGVNVELVWFEGYLDSINAFAAGQLDANTQTLNDTLASVAAGSDQRIVLVNDNSTGNDQIIVSEGITTIQDLVGKTVGIEVGVVDHFLLALGLEDAGLSLEDVNVTSLETGAAAAAFSAGQLDAVGAFAPFTTQALTREGSHVLFDSSEFPGAIPDHLVVSGALVDERPDVVQGLIDAWYLTLAFIESNPDEAIEIMAKRAGVTVDEYKEYDAGTTLFSIDDNIAAFTAGEDITHLNYAADEIALFLIEVGFVEGEFDYSKMLEPKFIEAYKAANP